TGLKAPTSCMNTKDQVNAQNEMLAYQHILSTAHGDHRNLHSFPTRRSSDLVQKWTVSTVDLTCTYFDKSNKIMLEEQIPKISVRSEEHTSELQSLAYLVCRLLLEKKK